MTLDPIAASAFPQPEWNDPDSVTRALQSLAGAHDEASAHEACDEFLFAVGDNLIGTYHPVVLVALPALERLLVNGSFWAQHAVLQSLIDLGGTFIPAEGFESHEGVAVKAAVQAAIHSMRPHVLALSAGSDARSRSAVDLLELIDDLAN